MSTRGTFFKFKNGCQKAIVGFAGTSVRLEHGCVGSPDGTYREALNVPDSSL